MFWSSVWPHTIDWTRGRLRLWTHACCGTSALQAGGQVDAREWRFLLAGPTASSAPRANPASDWLTEQSWVEVTSLAGLPGFAGFDEHFSSNLAHYKHIFDSSEVSRQSAST